jgi:TPR repeat protein
MILLFDLKDQVNAELGLEYLRQAADNRLICAHLHFATRLRQGRVIKQDLSRSAHDFKFAADQGSREGQFEYAICLLYGDGASIDHRECENYFREAVKRGDMRAQMRLGICLWCGMFGRFEFDEARALFDLASISN